MHRQFNCRAALKPPTSATHKVLHPAETGNADLLSNSDDYNCDNADPRKPRPENSGRKLTTYLPNMEGYDAAAFLGHLANERENGAPQRPPSAIAAHHLLQANYDIRTIQEHLWPVEKQFVLPAVQICSLFLPACSLLAGCDVSYSGVGDQQIAGEQPHSDPRLLGFRQPGAGGAKVIVLFAVPDAPFPEASGRSFCLRRRQRCSAPDDEALLRRPSGLTVMQT